MGFVVSGSHPQILKVMWRVQGLQRSLGRARTVDRSSEGVHCVQAYKSKMRTRIYSSFDA